MPSPRSQPLRLLALTLLVVWAGSAEVAGSAAAAAVAAAPARDGLPPVSNAEVRAAATRAALDPHLGHEYQTRDLRWDRADDPPKPPERRANWLSRGVDWIGNLFGSIAGGARWLLIAAGAIAAAWLGAWLWRTWIRRQARGKPEEALALPTHIRGLDIRPAQLPEDPAAVALALWNEGRQRQALVLLYRAALSRLVHRWRVPINDASTEGECVALADPLLPELSRAYLRSLIGAWSNAAYASLPPGAQEFSGLCAGFGAGLDLAPGQTAAVAP